MAAGIDGWVADSALSVVVGTPDPADLKLIEATGVERHGDEIRVSIQVTGDGYNGGGAMTFVLSGDRIGRMVITG